MNDNTKIEIAVEIMSAKIASVSREQSEDRDKKLEELMKEREKMYKFDEEVIDKIINVYGKELYKKG